MLRYSIAVLWLFFIQASASFMVIQSPATLTVNEGEFTVISCTFKNTEGHLAASAGFYRMPNDRNPINNSSDGRIKFSSTNYALIMTIHKAIICDSGTYICRVKFFPNKLYWGNGTTLNVRASESTTTEILMVSYTQTIVELIRISLLVILIILTFILLCKLW